MENQQIKKCVILCRVSSKEQEETGYSLPAQENYLKDYCFKKDFEVIRVFSISESASGEKQREKFKQMINYVKRNNIKVMVCEKADRLTRNFKDMVMIDEWVRKDGEREVHLVKDSLIMHRDSRSQEKLNWGIRILFAKNYIDNLSEEVKKGQKAKIEAGWLPTKPPYGYKTVGNKGHKIHVIDKKVAPLIKQMFELYSSANYSLNSLVEKMYKEGLRSATGKKLGTSIMHRLLKDPFYYGKMRWNDEIYQGKHEPLITEEVFDKVQVKITRKLNAPQFKKHLSVFKGKIRCEECGGAITWSKQRGKWYGNCKRYNPCTQKKHWAQHKIETQVLPLIEDLAPKDKRTFEWLVKTLKESHKDKTEHITAKRDSLNNSFSKIENRLEKIYEDKLDGIISANFYKKKAQEYTDEKQSILSELKRLEGDNTQNYEIGFKIHELALRAKNIYESKKATNEDRRLLLSYAISEMTLKNGKISLKYTEAFDFLKTWLPRINATVEHAEKPVFIEGKSTFSKSFPCLLGGRESNPD